jgi:CDK-activating kinase assembly factor MAT1
MQNGHMSNEADGETLHNGLAHLSLRRKVDANAMTDEDICPVCKNSTYLQKNLRFKINTKCYHRICEGCVDRITSTQKKCPIAGCTFAARGVIPRRSDYRVQTFEDLAIEREVDIRKRVMAMYVRMLHFHVKC